MSWVSGGPPRLLGECLRLARRGQLCLLRPNQKGVGFVETTDRDRRSGFLQQTRGPGLRVERAQTV